MGSGLATAVGLSQAWSGQEFGCPWFRCPLPSLSSVALAVVVVGPHSHRLRIDLGLRGRRSLCSSSDLVQEPSWGWPLRLGCAPMPRPHDPWRKAFAPNYLALDLCLDAQGQAPQKPGPPNDPEVALPRRVLAFVPPVSVVPARLARHRARAPRPRSGVAAEVGPCREAPARRGGDQRCRHSNCCREPVCG